MTTGLTGCGTGNGFFGQVPKTYNITITATSGTIQHSVNVTLSAVVHRRRMMNLPMRYSLLLAASLIAGASLQAQQTAAPGHQEVDVAATYTEQYSNLVSTRTFWHGGGSVELSTQTYRGWGLAANVTVPRLGALLTVEMVCRWLRLSLARGIHISDPAASIRITAWRSSVRA